MRSYSQPNLVLMFPHGSRTFITQSTCSKCSTETGLVLNLAAFSHQIVDATQRVIGIVEWVGQLVHPIVGLAVAIETHSYSRTGKKRINLDKINKQITIITSSCFIMLGLDYGLHEDNRGPLPQSSVFIKSLKASSSCRGNTVYIIPVNALCCPFHIRFYVCLCILPLTFIIVDLQTKPCNHALKRKAMSDFHSGPEIFSLAFEVAGSGMSTSTYYRPCVSPLPRFEVKPGFWAVRLDLLWHSWIKPHQDSAPALKKGTKQNTHNPYFPLSCSLLWLHPSVCNRGD